MLKKHDTGSLVSDVVRITFTLPADIAAESAYLVGTFNDWDPHASLMTRDDDGKFAITLDLAKDNEYQFRYLVNGSEWYNDDKADRYDSNSLGGENSVVKT